MPSLLRPSAAPVAVLPRNRRLGAWQVETNPLVRNTDYLSKWIE
jgi:hypothetical protein